ncbi:MAG: EAL domain-containing protein [Phycisphaeraceae bacterium]
MATATDDRGTRDQRATSSDTAAQAGIDGSVAPAAKPAPQLPSLFVGRQPIFDEHRKVVAYELLYRGDKNNAATFVDGNAATARTVDTSLNLIGLRALVDGHIGYFNFTKDLIIAESYAILPCEHVVIELLEDMAVDQTLIDACVKLKEAGYKIALDDFVFSPQYEPLLKLADVVKLDVMATSPADCREIINQHHRPNLIFLAEKVETYEVFEKMKQLGCQYFQGYFFCKPEVLSTRPLSGAKPVYLQFMQQLTQAVVDYDALEQILKLEVSLSIKLLRYINSAAVGLPVKVGSIKQALSLLGEKKLKQWGALAVIACLNQDKPTELARTSLVRARFCELLAPDMHWVNDLDLFLLGLLSALDAMMDRPMVDALRDLPVAAEIKNTLLGGNSRLGKLYLASLACERGDWKRACLLGRMLGIVDSRMAEAYRDAMAWADTTVAVIDGD